MPSYLLLLILALTCHSKLIDSKPQTHFNLQVGAALQQKIPRLFYTYQHSRLEHFTKDQQPLPTQLCTVRLDKTGELELINSLPYDSAGFTDKQIEDTIIYDINDLKTFKTFVDAIHFQNKLIALFQYNEVVVYNLDLTTGRLSVQATTNITEIEIFDDVELTIFGNYCYIISHEWIVNIDIAGHYELILDYQYQQFTLGEAVNIGALYCVAEGEAGLYIYVYDKDSESLKLVRNATFEVSDDTVQADFAVDEFSFDRHTGQIFILDHQQGLLKTKFSQLYNSSHVAVNKSSALMGGCENLVVTAGYVYLTCPELVQLNRTTMTIENIMLNSFYPYAVNHTTERIYLFGRQEFAIFDTYGQLVEEHALGVRAEKSIAVGEYIVTFTTNRVISNRIVPHSDQLYCTTDDTALTGSYHGMYRSYGLCNEYNQSHVDSTQVCFVEYPFVLRVTDSAPASNTLEVVLLVVWGGVLFLAAVYCSVKNFILHRGYTEMRDSLVEQEVEEKQKSGKGEEEVTNEHFKQGEKAKEKPKEQYEQMEDVIQ